MLAMREPYRFCAQHTPQYALSDCVAYAAQWLVPMRTASASHQPTAQGFATLCCHRQAQHPTPLPGDHAIGSSAKGRHAKMQPLSHKGVCTSRDINC